MNSTKLGRWAGIALGFSMAAYLTYTHLQSFSNISFLGGALLLEVIVFSLWKYEQRFFVLLLVAFAWAGMNIALASAWTAGRWVVLGAGAIVGFIVWTKSSHARLGSLDLIAFFCVCSAFVSAGVSEFHSMAFLKALSLLLLFLYCVSGARLAFFGREARFFHGLLQGSEIVVYATAICYLGLGNKVWGNPNSLGAVMGVAIFPVLLWGWVNSDGQAAKMRRLISLVLCTYLVIFSMARAGIISMAAVTIVFCVCLHQYKLLLKVVSFCLLLIAVTGMFAPQVLDDALDNMKDAMLYKGHKEEGLLGSRLTPWQQTIASIKEHPLFGTGYGTSPSGEDPGMDYGRFASSAETARENGSSYLTLAEWTGLLGVLPFVLLLGATTLNVWKTCAWMRRTADPRHYSIPLAMVALGGLIHANFEDWLCAVGYHICVYFWSLAFVLADLVPVAAEVPASRFVSSAALAPPVGLRPVAPNPAIPNPAVPNR